ncbi:MAG TPA: homoserine dehydrogenase [Vicinamibacteria bacterium]
MSRGPAPVRLALLGFGSVGRRFVELLPGPYGRVLRERGLRVVVTGIATARHGLAVDGEGLPLRRALALVRAGRALDGLHRGPRIEGAEAFIRRVPADVLFEITPLAPRTGQPAIRYARLALARGQHVVTANKGPVAHARRALLALARRRGVRFLHEGAVMDGTPIFNMVERCLPGAQVLGFRGLLNSTTTRILTAMEQGRTASEALREAQAAGVTEADPSHDLEGWDAAVKGCVLANALMGAEVRPPQVRRRGITGVTGAQAQAALRAGERLRLIVRASRASANGRGRGGVTVSVAPERVPVGDFLVSSGSDGALVLSTDLMGEVGIWEGAGGVDQTAYALLSDLLAAVG